MRTLLGALLVALAFALAFAACERIVVLTPFPGGGDDGGADSFAPDAHVGMDGGMHFDGGLPFPDAAAGLD
ncbi:MAG: hypothetical protein ABJE66_14755 [Deltaproteobacteria bacterium]